MYFVFFVFLMNLSMDRSTILPVVVAERDNRQNQKGHPAAFSFANVYDKHSDCCRYAI